MITAEIPNDIAWIYHRLIKRINGILVQDSIIYAAILQVFGREMFTPLLEIKKLVCLQMVKEVLSDIIMALNWAYHF